MTLEMPYFPTNHQQQQPAHAKNFYLLKIHLTLFEISNRVLKFENLIQIWKSFIPSENLFQTFTLRSGAMCVYSSLSYDKDEYTKHCNTLFEIHFQTEYFK